MPVDRLRMRPWLENIINERVYPGVEWIDEEKKIFRLPWKHASRNGWKINSDASLFRAWAEHTGKYKGKERPNPKTWKANFRCALNSLPDMEEVRDQRSTKGNNAYKVYRIINRANDKKKASTRKCRGRSQRKRRHVSRTNSVEKEAKLKTKEDSQFHGDVEVLEPIEIATDHSFSVPQPDVKLHLVDHDYACPKYVDWFEPGEDLAQRLGVEIPIPKVVKTEPRSPTGKEMEDCSFYEDDESPRKFGEYDSGDSRVMSDDEVIDLIDELSSESGSSNGPLDAQMENFADSCLNDFDEGFILTKRRSNSAPALLESQFKNLAELATNITRSKSMADIQSIMTATPQEFLQSCLS